MKFKTIRRFHDQILFFDIFKQKLLESFENLFSVKEDLFYQLGFLFQDFREALEDLLQKYSPWFNNSYRLLRAFFNANGSKLLQYSFDSATIRNTEAETKYYIMNLHFGYVTVYRRQTFNKAKDSVNLFFEAVINSLSEESDEDYTTVTEKIFSGWCLTKNQMFKAIQEIKNRTPDLCWLETEDSMSLLPE